MTTKEMEYGQDDKTVILNRKGDAPAQSPLTDFAAAPKFEQLEERMIYAARLRPAETFNISLNPLVAAAAPLLSEVVRLKHSQETEDLRALNANLVFSWRQVEIFQQRPERIVNRQLNVFAIGRLPGLRVIGTNQRKIFDHTWVEIQGNWQQAEHVLKAEIRIDHLRHLLP